MQRDERHLQHWRKTRRFTVALLTIWFAVTFLTIWFARDLQSFTFFGFPFSFYMSAQGAMLIYLILVGFYAWRMDRLDRAAGAGER